MGPEEFPEIIHDGITMLFSAIVSTIYYKIHTCHRRGQRTYP